MHRLQLHRATAIACLSLTPACGSSETTQGGNAPQGGGGQSPGTGAAGHGTDLLDGSPGSDTAPPTDACAALRIEAKRSPVDIIFVIDSSSSMVDEIAQVRQNINGFAQTVGSAGLDYRVVMIAEKGTEDTSMCVPEPLAGPDCASHPPAFHHADVKVSSKEHLYRILTSYDHHDPQQAWADFARYDAVKTFVAISDDNSYLEAEDFEKDLFVKKPAGMFGSPSARRYQFHSICGWAEGTPWLDPSHCPTAVNNGEDFQVLSVLTGGTVDSVCKQDYSAVLQDIAKGVVASVGCQFTLPDPSSGQVNHDNVVVNYYPSGATAPDTFDRVSDAAKCSAWSDGWYYDDNDAPTQIHLCPEACAKVKNDPAAKVEILVGCVAVEPK